MLRELWQQGAPSLSDLLAMFQISTKEELKERLKNTSSARTFAEDADRATGSVLFMLAKAADLIQFLRVEGSGAKPFAFRDFIHGLDKLRVAKSWIFVTRNVDSFKASKPHITSWLDCASRPELGSPPS